MYTLLKKLILFAIPFVLFGCMKEDAEDCAIYLEFVFDYNMEFTDLFELEIDVVDVYVFDEAGFYLFSRHADCATDLIDGKRMRLEEGFSLGSYKIITVGGLSRYFRFTDLQGKELVPGVTKIEDVQLSLYHETNDVEEEFPHLWFGKMMEIEFKADLSVWPVSLIRQTNHFNISVQYTGNNVHQQLSNDPVYTFDIVTPEGGAYGYDNTACVKETLTYHPYSLSAGVEPDILTEAKIRTMRLLAEESDGYHLIVRNRVTGEEIRRYNVMDWLEESKPTRADGSSMVLQEYLDREWEWNIVIRVGDSGGGDGGFAAVSILVNGWIIWIRDIEI